MNYIPVGQRDDTYDLFALVKRIEVKTSSKGQKYMDLTLGDKDGDIDAKYWDYQEGVTPMFEVNSIVKVRGQLQEFRGAPQFRVSHIRATVPSDNVRPQDYIAMAEFQPEAMYRAILALTDNFKDRDLADLLKAVFEKYKKELLLYPAAVRLHHSTPRSMRTCSSPARRSTTSARSSRWTPTSWASRASTPPRATSSATSSSAP